MEGFGNLSSRGSGLEFYGYVSENVVGDYRPALRIFLPCTVPNQYYLETFPSDGFVQPYGDSPLDDETVGENVYRNIISNAKKICIYFHSLPGAGTTRS